MDNAWCLYKRLKYSARLIEFKQDLLKYKMVGMLSKDFNIDAALLQKANDEFCNLLYCVMQISKVFE